MIVYSTGYKVPLSVYLFGPHSTIFGMMNIEHLTSANTFRTWLACYFKGKGLVCIWFDFGGSRTECRTCFRGL
ncbi:hypothetical protein M419DRAFT_119943 [Trichoderma reesei RUT C-30]|uniref:Uncharacterized protein n=1 Tax=Hypocrea jecorina (strain ATCC 56765 / BCRC 32924 / NRRL 11460 / Rut C-30) TaxID=1344414 RepID=A0A024S3R0_HYPJR|nr:hypothetical protein M419DRAFT_119943 [Trichoderma reesei RUT C-30]